MPEADQELGFNLGPGEDLNRPGNSGDSSKPVAIHSLKLEELPTRSAIPQRMDTPVGDWYRLQREPLLRQQRSQQRMSNAYHSGP